MIPQITDLRTLSSTEASAIASQGSPVAIVARQSNLLKDTQKRALVTVPDFLGYARLISTGNATQIISQTGTGRFLKSGTRTGIGLLPRALKLLRGDFWAGAEALLRYDLAMLPSDWAGPIMLHSQLTDFALALRNEDFLRRYFTLTKRFPVAGVHTQQIPAALSAFARLNLRPASIAFPWSSGDNEFRTAISLAMKSQWFEETAWLAEADFYPPEYDIMSALMDEKAIPLSGAIVSPATINNTTR